MRDGRNKPARCFFLLNAKHVTSEGPIALFPTLIRWWEWLRAPEVWRWQERHRVWWDATDGRNGGAERTAWETLPETGRFDYRTGDMDQGAITVVLDLATTFERVSLPVVLASVMHFNLPRKILRVLCGDFEHQRRVQFEGPSSLGQSGAAPSQCVARCSG